MKFSLVLLPALMALAVAAIPETLRNARQLKTAHAQPQTVRDRLIQRRSGWPKATFEDLFDRRSAKSLTTLDRLLSRRSGGCGNPSVEVMGCVEPLKDLEHIAQGFELKDVDEEEALNHICDEFQEAMECVARVHGRCQLHEDLPTATILETMIGVVGHMCSPKGKAVILGQMECWENEDMHEDVEECSEAVQIENNPCVALDNLKNCTADTIRHHCNDEAANFVYDLMYYAIKPVANNFLHCEFQMRQARSLLKMLARKR